MSDAFQCDKCGDLHEGQPALELLKSNEDTRPGRGIIVPKWELCSQCERTFRTHFGFAEQEGSGECSCGPNEACDKCPPDKFGEEAADA